MYKSLLLLGVFGIFPLSQQLSAHCQIPCGIYHDAMVYDQVDQYIETMFKGMTIISDNKFENAHDKNEFVRWVIEKEKESNNIAELITFYFLQQKIKPGEENTPKRLASAHKLLFLAMQIKQGTTTEVVNQFADEWDEFKVMFHVEDYECQVAELKCRKKQTSTKTAPGATASPTSATTTTTTTTTSTSTPPKHDHEHTHDHGHDSDHAH